MKANLENDSFFLDLVIDGIIAVDEDGNVVNNRTGKAIGFITGGYKRISMFGRTCAVNRLVYMVYVNESIPAGYLVNHKDGNKLHNHPNNLNLKTESENNSHAYSADLREINLEHLSTISGGHRNGMAALNTAQVRAYRVHFDNSEVTIADIIADSGLSRKAVVQMLNAKTYTEIPYRISRSTRKHGS
jgi:hypothetical protein